MRYEIRQVDAYWYGDDWAYNTCYCLGHFTTEAKDVGRAFRSALRRLGVTFRRGRTTTYDDGFAIEIQDRKTREPLFAAVPDIEEE